MGLLGTGGEGGNLSALYRKYRPADFIGVIGQDHVTSTLRSAVKKGVVGHAYLFSGPRGCGKTTMARLLAKSVNCTNLTAEGEPCNKCQNCQDIRLGQAVDITEIDAASNRGIDEIRELRDRILFAPANTKYKVYIIDEVHMLTKEAFNALLKTLEEPPAHAIFILATTELHKVPDTIISRCQRFQFHRAPDELLTDLLLSIAKQEGIKLEREAARVIAKRADGSYRDALTLLGNVAVQEQQLTGEQVRQLLGLPQTETVHRVLKAIRGSDREQLQKLLKEFLSAGGDVLVLTRGIAEQLREGLLGESDPSDGLILERLLLALARARHSSDPTALLLSTFLTFDLPSREEPDGSRTKEASVVSEPVASKAVEPAELVASPVVADLQRSEKHSEPVSVDAVTPLAPVQPVSNPEFWSNLVSQIKVHNHALYAIIRSARLERLEENSFVIAVQFKFYSDRLMESKNKRLLEESATKVAGRPLTLTCEVKTAMDIPVKASDDLLHNVVEVFEIETVEVEG